MLLRSVRGTQRAAEPGRGGSVLTLFPVQIPSLHSTGWNVCSNINKFLGVWFQHSMAVVIHLQVVPIAVGTMDFSGLTIPDGGVHIVGGELGE